MGSSGTETGTLVGEIQQAIRPLVEAEGYDLVLLELATGDKVLRLYIDREDGTPVGINDCTQVSRWVSDVLDAEGLSDRIPGTFNLEVSSPGLDRPLTRPKDFQRFVGSRAKVTTNMAVIEDNPDRRRFSGDLKAADENRVELEVDGQAVTIPYPAIERARLVPQW